MAKYALSKVIEYDAHGGPPSEVMGGDNHMQTPTAPGRFLIHSVAKHISYGKYVAWSGVAWGTPMRRTVDTTEIMINNQWVKLTSANSYWPQYKDNQKSISDQIQAYYKLLHNSDNFPDKWVFNDFGHISVKYFRDLNNDKKLNGKERIQGDFIHTTPVDEASTARKVQFILGESHGCIHVRPTDIDKMIQTGYIKTGNVVEVHPYNDLLIGSTLWRDAVLSKFEVHFFPILFKLVVYKTT